MKVLVSKILYLKESFSYMLVMFGCLLELSYIGHFFLQIPVSTVNREQPDAQKKNC